MTIFEKVKPLIDERFIYEGDLAMSTRFVEDLGADSLDTIELVSDIEDLFGIDIPDEGLVNIFTIGDVVRYIESRIQRAINP